jgi:peptidoglycan/LPS O-acetylase OafA/YrhL
MMVPFAAAPLEDMPPAAAAVVDMSMQAMPRMPTAPQARGRGSGGGHGPAMFGTTWRFFLRRLLRMVPAYAVALPIFVLVVNGSDSDLGRQQADNCRAYWWSNVLFINNFVELNTSCMAWAWTIALEIQFYLISPLFVYASVRGGTRAGLVLLGALSAGSIATYMALTALIYGPTAVPWVYTDVVYQRPYTRAFAYTLGMMAALAVERDTIAAALVTKVDAGASTSPPASASAAKAVVTNAPSAQQRIVRGNTIYYVPGISTGRPTDAALPAGMPSAMGQQRAVWAALARYGLRALAIATVLAVAVTCQSYENLQTGPAVGEADAYLQVVLSRPLFAVGLAYIVYDLLSPRTNADRYARMVNRVLSLRPFYVLAQVSYGFYLLHLTLVFVLYIDILRPLVLSGALAFDPRWMFPTAFATVAVASTLGGMVLFYTVERPGINAATDFIRRPGRPPPAAGCRGM